MSLCDADRWRLQYCVILEPLAALCSACSPCLAQLEAFSITADLSLVLKPSAVLGQRR